MVSSAPVLYSPSLLPEVRSPIDSSRRTRERPAKAGLYEIGAQKYAEGSALISMGDTRVLCAVSVEDRVPPFLRGTDRGWVTAEYSMLPRSTLTRTRRETTPRGRTQEIQRLIGRSLRAAVDMEALGKRTLTLDCDVLQADGGTRTASVTGAYAALCQALLTLRGRGDLKTLPLRSGVAAVSVGIVDGEVLLDLCYEEDSRASVDFNIGHDRRGRVHRSAGNRRGRRVLTCPDGRDADHGRVRHRTAHGGPAAGNCDARWLVSF